MGAKKKYDFAGYATRYNVQCDDGVTIAPGAFSDQGGKRVALCWQHNHDEPSDVLGHAIIENRPDGMYAYCSFNASKEAQDAKLRLEHGDVDGLSIWANKLTRKGNYVQHGTVREVSLVISGANPMANVIEYPVIQHGANLGDLNITEGQIYVDDSEIQFDVEYEVQHSAEPENDDIQHDGTEGGDNGDETIQDVFDTMNDKQKKVVYYMLQQVSGDKGVQHDGTEGEVNNNDDNEGGEEMGVLQHSNVFAREEEQENKEFVLSHDAMKEMLNDQSMGSLSKSIIAHAGTYGINDIEILFPDAKAITNTPDFIKRETAWVQKVLGATHHTPFSRIKSVFADITEDEARARGYIKGNLKKEEVFGLLKRTTEPQTIYKKQKLDRDDILDITDFDVVVWLKQEMRMMLDEEIARAILIGDGRASSSEDKIREDKIRSILNDDEFYSIKYDINVAAGASEDDKGKAFIRAAVKSRKNYKGSGNPILFTTEDELTNMLLLEDGIGRRLYDTEEKLRTALRVSDIVTVEVMEGVEQNNQPVAGIIVNLKDYNVGADKGGQVAFFDDFDIDYNQQKYLIETRMSGALIKPFSAIVLRYKTGASSSGSNSGSTGD